MATRLFVEQGYEQTTLVQIAEEAEVAPSTFFNYFPTKVDIVFFMLNAVIEGAQRRIAEHPEGETASEAITAWLTEELPEIEEPHVEAIRRLPSIVSSSPELRMGQRLRHALLEDALAAGFARDLREPAEAIRPRVLAVIALHGMLEAWRIWFEMHVTDPELDLSEGLEAKAAAVAQVLERGLAYIELLPAPFEPIPRSAPRL